MLYSMFVLIKVNKMAFLVGGEMKSDTKISDKRFDTYVV